MRALIIALVAALIAMPAMAQQKIGGPVGHVLDKAGVKPLGGQSQGSSEGGGAPASGNAEGALSGLLQKIYDKIHADGEKLIADMKKAQSVASAKFADGTMADGPSQQCLAAAIPVVQLIVDNQIVPPDVTPAPADGTPATAPTAPSATTPDGPVTIFVKIRVVVNALQSQNLQKGCSWLQQNLQQVGTQGLANVFAGLIGAQNLAPILGAAL